jgi:hypothetical protein
VKVALLAASALFLALYLPAAIACWHRLRTNEDLKRRDMADARSFIRLTPLLIFRMLERPLLAIVPAMWEVTCVVNAVAWPVRDILSLRVRWRR